MSQLKKHGPDAKSFDELKKAVAAVESVDRQRRVNDRTFYEAE